MMRVRYCTVLSGERGLLRVTVPPCVLTVLHLAMLLASPVFRFQRQRFQGLRVDRPEPLGVCEVDSNGAVRVTRRV